MRPLTPDDIENEIREAIQAGDTERILKLEVAYRTAQGAIALPGLCGSALWYANHQLHVFPVQAGTKIPHRGFRWRDEATTQLGLIREWWNRWPDANIGIATGHLVDVIDVDGPPGVKSWATHKHLLEQVIGKVSTPRPGGNHLYVPAQPERGNGAKILPGIDYRGAGGYVVAPPSVTSEGHYVWYQPLELP